MKNLKELPQIKDSFSFLYVERCHIEKNDNGMILRNSTGEVSIPVASLCSLLLGPGVSITHAAVKIACENGCSLVWVGDMCTRFYAFGTGETKYCNNLIIQAKLASNKKLSFQVAKNMYVFRFGEVSTDCKTLTQLRGYEGIEIKRMYKELSNLFGVKWIKRVNLKKDWKNIDEINRAISVSNNILYGICHAAIVSAGYSPALGFIHHGEQTSFVCDIADLYKSKITLPACFEYVSKNKNKQNLESNMRNLCREKITEYRLLDKIINDIESILKCDGNNNT